MAAKDFLAVSKEECGPSLTVEVRKWQISEVRMGLNLTVIWKEQQLKNRAFERELIAVVAAPAWMEVLRTVREPSAAVQHVEGDVKSGSDAV